MCPVLQAKFLIDQQVLMRFPSCFNIFITSTSLLELSDTGNQQTFNFKINFTTEAAGFGLTPGLKYFNYIYFFCALTLKHMVMSSSTLFPKSLTHSSYWTSFHASLSQQHAVHAFSGSDSCQEQHPSRHFFIISDVVVMTHLTYFLT